MFSLRSFRHVFLVLMALVLFAACTPTEIISTKESGYTQKVESLYVQSFVSERLDSFPVAAAQRIKLSMVSRSVPVTAEHVTLDDSGDEAPSLEEDIRMSVDFASAREGESSHVMFITEKSRVSESTTRGGTMDMAGPTTTSQTWTFDISLYDVEMEKRIWRATVKQEGSAMTTQSAEGVKMAQELVSKLDEDQLLPPLVQGNGR